MSRRSHAKTRTGCATCKARRIKCKEERPECRNCIKHGVQCPGYTQIIPRGNASSAIRQPSLSSDIVLDDDKSDTSEASLNGSSVLWSPHEYENSITSTAVSSVEWPGNWRDAEFELCGSPHRASWSHDAMPKRNAPTMSRLHSIPNHKITRSPETSDVNRILLQAFANAVQIVPSISFAVEANAWRTSLFRIAMKFQSLHFAMLSFAATYMHFLTENSQFAQLAIMHRGAALQALQHDMQKGGKDGLDAAIGSSILLADQSALEGDWKACILHSRGLNKLCSQSSIVGSLFYSTRAPKPQLTQQQHRKYNTEAIQATPDGLGCYTSLCSLQTFFSKMMCVDLDDLPTRDFIGIEFNPASTETTRQSEFSYGGVGHIIALACSVHSLHREIESDKSRSDRASTLLKRITHAEEEGKDWLECAPSNLITRAFDGDLPALVLITYKSALDLILHRCKLLLDPSLLPSPTSIKAIRFISEAYAIVKHARRGDRSPEDHTLMWECMAWPLWVLSWAEGFGDRKRALSLAQASNPALFRDELYI